MEHCWCCNMQYDKCICEMREDEPSNDEYCRTHFKSWQVECGDDE